MYPTSTPIPINSRALVAQDPAATNQSVPNNCFSNNGYEVPNGMNPYANSVMHASKKLQDELEKSGKQIKKHDDNLKFLKAQRNELDNVILDLQVSLGKTFYSDSSSTEDNDSSHGWNEDDIVKEIMKHELSAAAIVCQMKYDDLLFSQTTLSQEVVGVVATLGKVDDDNLSRLFSEYLGLQTMLAIVCKTYEGVRVMEQYDNDGLVNKCTGIYGIGDSIKRALEGRFHVFCLENLRPYAGEITADDPQRRLDIPKPRMPTGEIPEGFLGFAVNMIHVDINNLFWLTSSGCGLRETLFYNLFSCLQVYKTRAEMLNALPCISDGAVSLDGGMIRSAGVISLGTRGDMGVRFPKCSKKAALPAKYYELENQLKKKKWERERNNDDLRREQALLDQEKYIFSLKKQDFLKYLADSSNSMAQQQLQTAGRDRQAPL